MGEFVNRRFSKEDMQMAKKHMKRCSPSLATGDIQVKITKEIPVGRL